MPGGSSAYDGRKRLAHVGDDGERVGRRRRVDADEHGLEAVEGRGGIDVLGAECDIGDIAQPHERIAARRDDELAEGVGVVERGLGVDRRLDEVALDLAGGGGEVVGGERRTHLQAA